MRIAAHSNQQEISGLFTLVGIQGLEGLNELVRVVVNEAIRIERETNLQVRPNERDKYGQGHTNVYKPKTVKTTVGEVTFEVLQVYEGGFYPNELEAVACGLPTILTDVLDLSDWKSLGINSNIFTEGNSEDLAKITLSVLLFPTFPTKIQIEIINDEFGVKRGASNYLNL